MQVTDHHIIVNNDALQQTGRESIVFPAHEEVIEVGDVGSHGQTQVRLPKRVMSVELENAGKRDPGRMRKKRTDCVVG